MNWNDISDDLKKYIFEFTGGFRGYHTPLFRESIASIERRYTDYVCYICGLQNSFIRRGLSRNPSTKMYIKKSDSMFNTVEVFGKCCKHTDGPLSVDGVLVPRPTETLEQLYDFVEELFPGVGTVFMFTSHEDYRSSWRIIQRDKTSGSDPYGSNPNGSVSRTRSQSSLVP